MRNNEMERRAIEKEVTCSENALNLVMVVSFMVLTKEILTLLTMRFPMIQTMDFPIAS